jgi:hypothetical protein
VDPNGQFTWTTVASFVAVPVQDLLGAGPGGTRESCQSEGLSSSKNA